MTTVSDPISVLHVDDDPTFTEVAAEFLEREAARLSVATATSAEEGLEHLRSADVDCIISDYDMPGQNGIEFLETVRNEHPELPFVLYTGKGSEEVASEAISAGVTDYLQKETGTSQYTVLANRVTNAVEQSRTSHEAEQTRQRLPELTENVTDCVWLFDREWEEIVFVSGYEDVWGRPTEAIERDPLDFLDSVHPDDREFVEESMERASNGQTADIEYRILKNDELRWVRVRREPIFDEDGSVVRIAGFTRDITARKERERELERYETILEALGDPIYAVDADGCYTFVNDAFVEETGYDRTEIIGRHVSTVLPKTDVERGRKLIRELLSTDGKRTETWEMTRVTAEGEEILSENHLALLPSGENGEFRGTAGVVRDLTDHKEHERRIKALNGAARDLMAAETRQEVADMTTEAADEILDYPCTVVRLRENDDRLVPVAITKAMAVQLGGQRPTYEIGEETAGLAVERGETIVYDDVAAVDDDVERGNVHETMYVPIGDRGVMTISNTETDTFSQSDIDLAEILAANAEAALARVENAQELKRHNEQLTQFASTVAHDLKSPLSVATGNLELVATEFEDDRLFAAKDALDRMNEIVEETLSLARSGETIGDPEAVDLEALAERCLTTVDEGAADLQVADPPTIMADPVRTSQLLENLFANSLEHASTDDHPEADSDRSVTVQIGSLSEGFYVEDDGSGIPESNREMIFNTGYTTSEEGSGLGLSIVKRIAEAHGWTVRVTDGEDGGARFEITDVEIVQ